MGSIPNSDDSWSRAGVAILMVCLGGCAGVPKPAGWIADVRPERVKRARDASNSIAQQREQSEYQAATSQFQQGDTKGCRAILEGLLKRNPKHRESRLLLAELSLLERQPGQAREQLQLALTDHPDDPELLHTMGLAAEMESKADEAVDWFERAVKLAPDNEIYVMSFESAVEEQTTAAARPAVIAAEGGPLSRRKASPTTEATRVSHESDHEASRRADPLRGCPGVSPLFVASHESGRESPAPAASRFAEKTPEASAAGRESKVGEETAGGSGLAQAKDLVDRGGAALAAGAVETARGYFDRAWEAAGDDEKLRISAAVAALRHDELDLAAELAENGLEQFPESAGLYRVSGTAQYRRGDLQAAKSSLERALALDNASGLSYFLLGSTLAKLGQTQAAEWHLSQARRLDPRFISRR